MEVNDDELGSTVAFPFFSLMVLVLLTSVCCRRKGKQEETGEGAWGREAAYALRRRSQPGLDLGHRCCLAFSRPWAEWCLLFRLGMCPLEAQGGEGPLPLRCLGFCVPISAPVSGQLLVPLMVPAQMVHFQEAPSECPQAALFFFF